MKAIEAFYERNYKMLAVTICQHFVTRCVFRC